MAIAVEEATAMMVRNDDILSDQLQSMHNLEGITLIWYDACLSVITRKQLRISKKHLRPINDFVQFYKNEEECINTIKSITNEKILLVTSGSGAHSLLSFDDKSVHKSVQAVFIFCRNKQKYEILRRNYSKIIGIFNDPEELKASIEKEVTLIQAHFETFSFYNKIEEKSMVNLSKHAAKFLWLLIFKHLVMQMPNDEKAKRQMIDTCEKYYHGNKNEKNLIKEFKKTYKAEHAIRWYTRPSFVYKLVNKALRTEDIDQLYIFRFYIRDLCEDITKRQKLNNHQQTSILYRGVRLPLEEVEKLKECQGKLISTNGFLSTSLSKEVAMRFALTRTHTNTEESVVIEIECDQNSAAFAVIEKESVFSEENEVLFDLGATFEVLSVTKSREENAQIDIWIVKMRSTQERNELAQLYIERCQKTLKEGSSIEDLWGALLVNMGRLDKSIKFFQKLSDPSPLGVPIDQIFRGIDGSFSRYEKYDEVLQYLEGRCKERNKKNMIMPRDYFIKGWFYHQKGQYDQALVEFRTCIVLNTLLPEESSLMDASSYGCIGRNYYLKGQYQLALVHLNKSIEIGKKHYPDNHMFFAALFEDFGDVYRGQGELQCAMKSYQEAANMNESYCPRSNVKIFSKMGRVLCSLGNYEKSLENYNRVIEILISERCLDEPRESIYNFEAKGRIHRLKGELSKALECFEEVLRIKLQTLGPNHPFVARSYYTKGNVLEQLDRNDEALKAFQMALTIQELVFPDGHQKMARSLYSIGNQYRRKGELVAAKTYCDKALKMQKNLLLPPQHIDISFTLFHIGTILYDQEDYTESLKYLYKALKIQNNFSSGEEHPYQILTLIIISDVNIKLNNLDYALSCLKKALSIKEKFSLSPYSQMSEIRRKIEEIEQLKIS